MGDSLAGTGRGHPTPPVTSSRTRAGPGPIVQYLGYVTLALRDQNVDHSDRGHYNIRHTVRERYK